MNEEKNYAVLATGDDWQGLYVNGMLRCEDHRLDSVLVANEVLSALPPVYLLKKREADSDWLFERGSFPDTIEDVKWHEEKFT